MQGEVMGKINLSIGGGKFACAVSSRTCSLLRVVRYFKSKISCSSSSHVYRSFRISTRSGSEKTPGARSSCFQPRLHIDRMHRRETLDVHSRRRPYFGDVPVRRKRQLWWLRQAGSLFWHYVGPFGFAVLTLLIAFFIGTVESSVAQSFSKPKSSIRSSWKAEIDVHFCAKFGDMWRHPCKAVIVICASKYVEKNGPTTDLCEVVAMDETITDFVANLGAKRTWILPLGEFRFDSDIVQPRPIVQAAVNGDGQIFGGGVPAIEPIGRKSH
jgi:hypothetical protein